MPKNCPCEPARPTGAVQEQDPRLTWFREARFGLFIHWGACRRAAGRVLLLTDGLASPRRHRSLAVGEHDLQIAFDTCAGRGWGVFLHLEALGDAVARDNARAVFPLW